MPLADVLFGYYAPKQPTLKNRIIGLITLQIVGVDHNGFADSVRCSGVSRWKTWRPTTSLWDHCSIVARGSHVHNERHH
jgi:hypothetical protein